LLSHEYIHVLQQEGSVLNYSRYVNEAVAAYERGELTSGPTNRLEAMGYLWQRWNDAFDKYDVGRTGGARPSWCEFKPLFAGPANDWGC